MGWNNFLMFVGRFCLRLKMAQFWMTDNGLVCYYKHTSFVCTKSGAVIAMFKLHQKQEVLNYMALKRNKVWPYRVTWVLSIDPIPKTNQDTSWSLVDCYRCEISLLGPDMIRIRFWIPLWYKKNGALAVENLLNLLFWAQSTQLIHGIRIAWAKTS